MPVLDEPIKLCECGCGEPAPVALSSRRGYRRGDPMRFKRGHFSRTEAAAKPPVHIGPANGKWRGDQVSIPKMHEYVIRYHPKTGKCENCDAEGATDLALIHGREYSRNRADYLELCRLCHNRYDAPKGRPGRDPVTGRWAKNDANPVAQ